MEGRRGGDPEKNVKGVEKFLEISVNVFGVIFLEISSIFMDGL